MSVFVWHPTEKFSGLGDRLRALAAMRFVAMVRGAEKLFVYWPLNDACPYALDEVVRCDDIQTFTDSATVRGEALVMPQANGWGQTVIDAFPSIFNNFGSFSAIVSNELDSMMATCPFKEKLDEWWSRAGLTHEAIGVHLRRTDNIHRTERIEGHAKTGYLDGRLINELRDSPGKAVYVATDDAEYARAWPRMLLEAGLCPVTYPKPYDASRLRQTTAEGVLCDLLALSYCKNIYCSCTSSILLIAQRINKKPSLCLVS